MCTVIVAHRVMPQHPVWVAANRDEDLTRPAEGFAARGELFTPRDLKAGGTWLGVNRQRVFAAVTNRFGRPPDPARRSRGELVPTALAAPTAADGAARLRGLDGAAYNPFHAVIADHETAWVAVADGERLVVQPATGVIVLTERSAGAAPTAREEWLIPAARALALSGIHSVPAWWALLGTHREPSFEGTCVHWPERQYGTRSAAVLALGALPLLRAAEGSPCVTEPIDLDGPLQTFLGAPHGPA